MKKQIYNIKICNRFFIKYVLIFFLVLCFFIITAYASKDEYIGGGFILYENIVYAKGNDNSKRSKSFFDVVNKIAKMFDNAKTTFIQVIQSKIYLEDIDNLVNDLKNQKETIEKFKDIAGSNINVINYYDELKRHLNEYVFFKYDNHWTSRGVQLVIFMLH